MWSRSSNEMLAYKGCPLAGHGLYCSCRRPIGRCGVAPCCFHQPSAVALFAVPFICQIPRIFLISLRISIAFPSCCFRSHFPFPLSFFFFCARKKPPKWTGQRCQTRAWRWRPTKRGNSKPARTSPFSLRRSLRRKTPRVGIAYKWLGSAGKSLYLPPFANSLGIEGEPGDSQVLDLANYTDEQLVDCARSFCSKLNCLNMRM